MTRYRNHLLHAAIALAIVACPSAALAATDVRSPDAILAGRDQVVNEERSARPSSPSPDAILAGREEVVNDVPVAPVVKVSDGGFDLGSAGIGAAAMLGLVLALAGGAIVVRPRVPRQSLTG